MLTWGQSIPNFGDIGHDYHPTMIAVKGIPSVSENLSKVFGTHTTKYGFFFQHVYNTQDNWGPYMGVLTYSPWNTPTGNNYADALMGIGASYRDRKSTRLNSSHSQISYAAFCLKKKKSVRYPCTASTT